MLTDRNSTIEKSEENCYYNSQSVNVAGNSMTGSTSWDESYAGGKCSGHFSGTCTWTAPPSVLTPGTKQETKETAQVEGGQSCAYKHIGAWMSMYVNQVGLSPQPNIGWSTNEHKPAPVSEIVPWEVPWGKIGDTMTIEFYPHVPAVERGGIIFTYTYQASAPESLAKPSGNIADDTESKVSLPKRSGEPMAFIDRIYGQGDFKVNGLRVKSEERLLLYESDTISTGPASEVVLMFSTGAKIVLKENTDFFVGQRATSAD